MKVLVVGLGSIGQRHARNLRTLLGEGLELMAWRVLGRTAAIEDGREVTSGAKVAERLGIREFTDLDAALAQRPDAVFLCNPSGLHIPVAIRAARAGAHLFLEKPLSDRYDGIDELIEVVESRRLTAVVGYQLRFHPCLRLLHSLLEQGTIGRVVAVRAEAGEALPDWHPYEDYRRSYAARADLGGGVLLTQIHEMDYLYWLFGRPRRIFAIGGKLSDLEIDVEDVASVSMECQSGGRTIAVHLHQDYLQRPARRGCEVIGTNGTIRMNLRAATLEVHDGEGRLVESARFEDLERNRMFLDEVRAFLDAMKGEKTPLVGLREAAESLRMALAAKRSLQTGEVVEP